MSIKPSRPRCPFRVHLQHRIHSGMHGINKRIGTRMLNVEQSRAASSVISGIPDDRRVAYYLVLDQQDPRRSVKTCNMVPNPKSARSVDVCMIHRSIDESSLELCPHVLPFQMLCDLRVCMLVYCVPSGVPRDQGRTLLFAS